MHKAVSFLFGCMAALSPLVAAAQADTATVTIKEDDRGSLTPSAWEVSVYQGGTVYIQNESKIAFYIESSYESLCGDTNLCTGLIAPGTSTSFQVPVNLDMGKRTIRCTPEYCGSIDIVVYKRPDYAAAAVPPARNVVTQAPPSQVPVQANVQNESLHSGAPLPKSGPAETMGLIIVGALLLFPLAYRFLVRG